MLTLRPLDKVPERQIVVPERGSEAFFRFGGMLMMRRMKESVVEKKGGKKEKKFRDKSSAAEKPVGGETEESSRADWLS